MHERKLIYKCIDLFVCDGGSVWYVIIELDRIGFISWLFNY